MDTGRERTYRGRVSSPGEQRRPDDGGPPYPNPYSDRPPAGQPDRPGGPYGSQSDAPPYVYNPYGNFSYPSSYPVPPAGLGPEGAAAPARRPGVLHAALVLLLLSAAPYLLSGLLLVLVAGDAATSVPQAQLDQLRELGVDVEQVVRAFGVGLLVVALVFVLLAVLAWRGRRWARALLAVLTVGFVLMALVSVLAASSQGAALDPGGLLVIAGPAVLALVGVVLMFRPAARAWFDRLRA